MSPPVTALHSTLVADRFEVTGPLGSGAQGHVLAAWDRAACSAVAIKVHAPDDALLGVHEGRILAHLTRCRVAAAPRFVAAVTLPDGRQAVVMEHVAGRPLGAHAPRLSLGDGRAAFAALASLHAAGVVHGDLKPDHVVHATSPGGAAPAIRYLDFGCARQVARVATEEAVLDGPSLLASLPYLAPERYLGQPASEAADLYALGVTLWEAATGAPPFPCDAPHTAADEHLYARIPISVLQCSTVPAALARLIIACLAKDPWRRPASARDAVARLGAERPARNAAARSG